MAIEKRDNRYFWEDTDWETFPFLPDSIKAKGKDFIAFINGQKRFKIGVEFFSINSYGFFDKYTSSTTTDVVALDGAIKQGLIYIKK